MTLGPRGSPLPSPFCPLCFLSSPSHTGIPAFPQTGPLQATLTLGPSHWLFPLPRTFSPQISTWLSPSPVNLCSNDRPLNEAFPTSKFKIATLQPNTRYFPPLLYSSPEDLTFSNTSNNLHIHLFIVWLSWNISSMSTEIAVCFVHCWFPVPGTLPNTSKYSVNISGMNKALKRQLH